MYHVPDQSLPQPNIIPPHPRLQRSSSCKQPGPTGVVTMGVNCWKITLVLESLQKHIFPLHPATRSSQLDSSSSVHDAHVGLQELAGTNIPEQHESYTCPHCQNIPLERHTPDTTPLISRGNLPDRLESPAVQQVGVGLYYHIVAGAA